MPQRFSESIAQMTDDVQPTRIILRTMTVFMIDAVRAAASLHRGDLTRAVAFTAIWSDTLSRAAPLGGRRIFAGPGGADHERRPVSINAIARSFSLPYETTRRAVSHLIKAGLCARVAGGLIVPACVLQSQMLKPATEGVSAAVHMALARLSFIGFDFDIMAQMADPGALGAPAASGICGAARPSAELVSWIATDTLLRSIEAFMPLWEDITSGFIFAGAMTANARALAADPVQAWTYSGVDTPPPDDARRAISVRALSELLGLPFETVRRRVKRMIAAGSLIQLENGVMASMAVLQSAPMQANAPMVFMRFARMIADLKQAGYDFPKRMADQRAWG
jgi:hypothetical protein